MAQGRTRQDLETDEMLRYAITHLVELIGESASQVPAEVQQQYPGIPWPKVVNMRHRLIHGYDFVDCDILWDTVIKNLPPLLAELDKILGEER